MLPSPRLDSIGMRVLAKVWYLRGKTATPIANLEMLFVGRTIDWFLHSFCSKIAGLLEENCQIICSPNTVHQEICYNYLFLPPIEITRPFPLSHW